MKSTNILLSGPHVEMTPLNFTGDITWMNEIQNIRNGKKDDSGLDWVDNSFINKSDISRPQGCTHSAIVAYFSCSPSPPDCRMQFWIPLTCEGNFKGWASEWMHSDGWMRGKGIEILLVSLGLPSTGSLLSSSLLAAPGAPSHSNKPPRLILYLPLWFKLFHSFIGSISPSYLELICVKKDFHPIFQPHATAIISLQIECCNKVPFCVIHSIWHV